MDYMAETLLGYQTIHMDPEVKVSGLCVTSSPRKYMSMLPKMPM